MSKTTYTVILMSENTNSFGYKSIFAANPDGTGVSILRQAYGTEPLPLLGDDIEIQLGDITHPLPAVEPSVAAKAIRETKKHAAELAAELAAEGKE